MGMAVRLRQNDSSKREPHQRRRGDLISVEEETSSEQGLNLFATRTKALFLVGHGTWFEPAVGVLLFVVCTSPFSMMIST